MAETLLLLMMKGRTMWKPGCVRASAPSAGGPQDDDSVARY